jgi:hypothetical protein
LGLGSGWTLGQRIAIMPFTTLQLIQTGLQFIQTGP